MLMAPEEEDIEDTIEDENEEEEEEEDDSQSDFYESSDFTQSMPAQQLLQQAKPTS